MSGLGVENLLAEKWIKDTFDADSAPGGLVQAATGGIWDGPARDGTKYPIVRYDPQSPGVEARGVSTTTIWLDSLWLIRGVVDGTSYEPLRTIASRIYALLHGSHDIAVTDGMIMWCVREQAFQQEIVEAGREYRHLGGIYRIVVQGT